MKTMIYYPQQPHNIPIPEGYTLSHTYIYHAEGNRIYIEIPQGFEYDGASVPRLVWTVSGLTPDGLLRAGALIHDYLYENKGSILPSDPQLLLYIVRNKLKTQFSRKEADKLFKQILIECGVSKYRANMAYFAVRAGGWTYWRS